ncbi:MAG TPA: hypothetical protein VFS10_12610 [Pyrinomonadaceae bacterium]|nr:hypothetical protein [Pyrinomonadaceae bacterium]
MADDDQKRAGDDGSAHVPGSDETRAERVLNRYVGDAIHLFLSLLAILILGVAVVATYQTAVHDFPKLLTYTDEYDVLQKLIQSVLLIAIAAELGLLLLYHRTSAAVEVIIFVIARKLVSPETSALELLLSIVALCVLLVVRFYYLPGRPK